VWHRRRDDVFKLFNISDVHLMAKGCSEKTFRADMQNITNDPHALWVGGGDYADFIGYRDKRFDPDAVCEDVSVKELADMGRAGMHRFVDIVRPAAPGCLGLILGNHEQKYELATEHEVLNSWACEELGVKYFGYCAMFHLAFYRTPQKMPDGRKWMPYPPKRNSSTTTVSYTVFLHHGAGYAATPGGKMNKLIQFMQSFQADIYMLGHVHDKVSRKEPMLGINALGTDIIQHERLGVISGSYLRTYTSGYTSYGEMKGYRPTSLGPAVVEIDLRSKTLRSEV
jgi:hypothetical protein